jgi:hypothetical protein
MSKNPPNQIIFKDDYLELHIFSNKHGEFIVKCDLDDYEKVKAIHWCVEFDGYNWYVRNRYKNLKLHRYLTDCPRDKIIDHINRDTLDNRKQNLRICTISDNNRNRPLTINYPHTTPYYGIGLWSYIYNGRKYTYYKVQISNFKQKVFKNLQDALKYRNEILEIKKGTNNG